MKSFEQSAVLSTGSLFKRLLERVFGPWVQQVSAVTLRVDAMAGLLGAVLVLPQGIAFATLAGLPPEYGLYTAIVPCIIAGLFGSSWHVMSGPTNANSLALYAMLAPLALAFSPLYIQLALAITVMVGILQWLIGALRLGVLANFISPAVLFGFTSGAALLIAVHALPDLLGLAAASEHSAAAVLSYVFSQLSSVQPAALAVGVITLGVALLVRRLRRNSPYMLIGLGVGTAFAWLWGHYLNVHAAGLVSGAVVSLRMIGQIATPWPRFEVPKISWAQATELVGLAFALTIVALGQAISIAKMVALRSGQRIDANREFRGQGLSNIVGGFFSCYVSCGSMNRSIPNLEAGARTPLASVFSALLLLALVALSAPLLAQIPMAALSALLVLVALALLDLARWRELFRLSRSDFGVALTTLVATVTIRLEIAILLGMLLSLMSFLYRTSRPAMRTMGFDNLGLDRHFVVIDDTREDPYEQPHPALPECPQLKLLRMEGEVYFGATQHVADILHALRSQPLPQKHLLVMAKSMNFIDLAGAELWEAELAARRAMGGNLYFHRPRPEVLRMWRKTGFTDLLGPEHQFSDKFAAISTIFTKLDPEICRHCTARIFWECKTVPGPDSLEA
ncbi:MAG: SulP family inorganic anion transporter [Polaromonas sp.]|uniref:SulP family inorganic anion transporter n=1 Tax=Polaromonas sp. TaxID=1869339 RepID=UPI001792DAEE|nr:SulP family inorganic anion transporter [Polaromonas sp.]NMM11243.1 SulP family inorganic anion transporter [Polaromonas sp.]